MPIEPLSDPFKELLTSVGINPNQFNQDLNAKLLLKAVKGRMSTQHGNKEYYNNVSRLETIGSVAARIQKAPKIYLPLGYVLFIRRAHCKNCQGEHVCMDSASLFLLETDKVGSPTRKYSPVSRVDYPSLPHWTKEVQVECAYCLECYSIDPVPAGAEGESAQTLAPSTPTEGSEQPEAPPCQP